MADANNALPLADPAALRRRVEELERELARGRQEREELGRCMAERAAELSRANELLRHEVAERARVEEALQKVADEFLDLYNGSPCGFHSLAADGTVVRMNDTELAWLGYARHEVVGKVRF